jgi:hypothetical protein
VLADLGREGHPEPLVLPRLSPREAGLLVRALSATPAAPAVVEAIYHHTQGNPFFVGQLVRHLQTEHHDLASARTAVGTGAVPAGVRQVIAARLARLSLDANRVLDAAAVAGDGVTFEVVSTTTVAASVCAGAVTGVGLVVRLTRRRTRFALRARAASGRIRAVRRRSGRRRRKVALAAEPAHHGSPVGVSAAARRADDGGR